MPKVKTFNQKFCKTFTQKKKIIIRVGAVFLQKQLFLYSILLCIKKLYKSIPVATFVGGIKNFATQDNTYEKWVLGRRGQAEYVAALKEVTGMEKCSQNPRKRLRSSEIKKYEMHVQRVKDILTKEFINSFSNEIDKTKLYNITSGTYTSNDVSECLLTIFERGKIRMMEFKERISKNASNKYIFDPIKREKWKSFEDTVKRTTKIKIDGKIKDIVEQKNNLGLLAAKSDQSKLAADIKNALPFPLASVSLPLASADGAMRKTKNLICMVQLIHSQITTYHCKITLVSTIYLSM